MFLGKLSEIKRKASERGFTIVEILIGVLIVGVLASIAYPVWTNIQNTQHESAVKQKLSQIAVLIEQESIDNNGYLPKYIPNEVLNDKIAKDFTFEHKNRLEWCATAKIEKDSLFPFTPPTTTLWFVSSENTTPSNTIICGGPGYEPMEGSSEPWDPPTIAAPAITSHNTSWPNTNNHATFNVQYSPGSCALNSTDDGLFNPDIKLQYRVELQNMASGRTSTVLTTDLSSLTNASIGSMAGFYPGDPYQTRVQSVCTVQTNNGYPYEYYSNWSSYVNGTTATFVVPTPTWNSFSYNIGTGNASTPSRFSAGWSSPYTCPTGSTKRYTIAVTLPGAASLPTQTVNTTTLSVTNQTLTQNKPGFRYNFALRAICDYTASGVNINVQSSPANKTERTVLRPPTGSMSVEPYTSTANSVTITPNGFVLNKGAGDFTCAAGNPVVTMNARDSSGVNYTSRTVSFGAVADYFSEILSRNSVNKNLTVTGSVACSGIVDGATQTSATSANTATDTFLIRYKIPAIPDKVAGFGNNSSGSASYNNDRLTWTHVSCEFDATPEYQVRQMQKSSKTVYAAASRPAVGGTLTTNYVNLTNTQIGAGSTVKFEVRARCTNNAGSSGWTDYATGTGASWTTEIPKPATPSGMSFSGTSTGTAKWNAVTCPAGTTTKYLARQTKRHTTNVNQVFANWITGRSAKFGSNWRQGHNISWTIQARCDGPDKNSAASSTRTHTKMSSLSAPVNARVTHPGHSWIFNLIQGTCPTGTTAVNPGLYGWTSRGELPFRSGTSTSWAGHWAASGGYSISGQSRCKGPTAVYSSWVFPNMRWGV